MSFRLILCLSIVLATTHHHRHAPAHVRASKPALPGGTGIPALVFVSRTPVPDAEVPGVGPRHRAEAAGGRLMVRSRRGVTKALLPPGGLYDVSDPCVSWDAKRIVFAGKAARDSAWRIYVVAADGTGLTALTHSDRRLDPDAFGPATHRFDRYDDLDPCWLADGRVCFASTRYPQIAENGVDLATNLFIVDADGKHLNRITSDRNGAEEPGLDPSTGRIVYARWWFSPYRPSEVDPSGVTTDPSRAIPADSVNLWQAISVFPSGDGARLAGGNPRVRIQTMAYQPIMLRDGTLVGVRAEHAALTPSCGRLSLQSFPTGFAEGRWLVGGQDGGSACSPSELPDGRVLFSYDREGRGDYALYAIRPNGGGLQKVFDLPGTLELDAAALVARPAPPDIPSGFADFPRTLPSRFERELKDSVTTFRFDCLNVFANGPVDAPFPDAPPPEQGLRIRFYATLARPQAPLGDTVLLLRDVPVDPSGAVHEHELPADTPMFEQLIDAHGHVLRSAMGPAHVPGFNAGRYGSGTKCVGCHIGHSAIPVAPSAHEGKRFNISPSAEVTVSSTAQGTVGARALVDRRARGSSDQVAWVSSDTLDQRVRLSWRSAIEVDTLVIYAISPQSSEGTDLQVHACELAFYLDGRVVEKRLLQHELAPTGTRVDCKGIRIDALEVRPTRVTGSVRHRAAVGLAEIETRARLIEDVSLRR